MEIYTDIHNYNPQGAVATLGFFDGVHLGHRFLIDQVKRSAKESGLRSMIITFWPHPRQVLNSDFQPELLNTLEEKIDILTQLDIDDCIILPFNKELASLSSFDFLKKLVDDLDVRELFIGHDHRFGKGRTDDYEQYTGYGRRLGIQVIRSKPFIKNGVVISSSVVRRLLENGDVEQAADYLAAPYCISGTVVQGHKVGRDIGFPTANIEINEKQKMIPAAGAYAVWVKIDGNTYKGMLNIGKRPTLNNGDRSIEVHIFDFSDDLYGKGIQVHFLKYIRPETKFDSLEDLSIQLQKDKEFIRSIP